MSDYICPECNAPIPTKAINIAEGVALCPACEKLTRLGELVDYERPDDDVINNPPRGCRIISEVDGATIRVSLRSIAGFLGASAICAFWNGIVSVFLVIAASGLYLNLVGPVPDWFPAPDMNGEPMSLGMTLFLCLFLTPFVLIGSFMFGAVLLNAMGTTDVRIGRDRAYVKTRVGPIGWTKRFDPRQVTVIKTGRSKIETNGEHEKLIHIEADRTVRFGTLMSDRKRQWLLAALQSMLLDQRP